MPELPEVETIRRGLKKMIVGQKIIGFEVLTEKSVKLSCATNASVLVGLCFKDIRRFGKLLVFDLSSGFSLLVHLRMTGQLVYRSKSHLDISGQPFEEFGGGHPTDSLIEKLPDNSTRVIFYLQEGSLFFNDQRKFGFVELIQTSGVETYPFIAKLGPEPPELGTKQDASSMVCQLRSEEFITRAKRHKGAPIKATILDQSVLSGVGNIYADETLWMVQVHPATPTGVLDSAKLQEIFDAAGQVMALSIMHGGSTSKNYVNAAGERGAYLDFANVFRRDGKPCPRCQTTIIKLRVTGRGTHICPKCQVYSS